MPKRNSPIQQIKKIVVQFFSVLFKTTCFSMNNRLYLRIGSRNTTDNTGYSKYREKRYFPYPHVSSHNKEHHIKTENERQTQFTFQTIYPDTFRTDYWLHIFTLDNFP